MTAGRDLLMAPKRAVFPASGGNEGRRNTRLGCRADRTGRPGTRPSPARVSGSVFGSAIVAIGMAWGLSARAEMSAEELAKLAQNPIANLISVPFQNNTNLNYGPQNGTQNILSTSAWISNNIALGS